MTSSWNFSIYSNDAGLLESNLINIYYIWNFPTWCDDAMKSKCFEHYWPIIPSITSQTPWRSYWPSCLSASLGHIELNHRVSLVVFTGSSSVIQYSDWSHVFSMKNGMQRIIGPLFNSTQYALQHWFTGVSRFLHNWQNCPDSKVHGANMGPIWGRQDPGGPHVGPVNFAIWVNNDDLEDYLELQWMFSCHCLMLIWYLIYAHYWVSYCILIGTKILQILMGHHLAIFEILRSRWRVVWVLVCKRM